MLATMDERLPLVVIADHREIPSGVPPALEKLGVRVELATLPAGDYVVRTQTKIERKTVRDLHSAVASSRFWQQLNRLRASAQYPIVVVEGQNLDAGPLSKSGVRGALVALGDRGIPVIRSTGPDDTALWIRSIALSRTPRKRVWVRPPYRRPTGARDGIEVSMLCAIPLVTLPAARALVARFGSIRSIAQATPAELRAVPGIGPRRADAVHRALTRSSSGFRIKRNPRRAT